MKEAVQHIIAKLERYILKAHQSGNKYDFIDPACELCQELEELEEPVGAVEPLFLLIERSPDIDYGGPGPAGAFLETFYGNVYEEQLIRSLKRKPTLYTLHLLERLIRDNNNPQQAVYLDLMRTIAADDSQPEHLRQEALEHLQYAVEHSHLWDDALNDRLAAAQVLLEETAAQQARQREALQQNEPLPSVTTVRYNNITFKVITRREAQHYLPQINDLPGLDQLYDVWDEWRFPTYHENAYFLLAEENVIAEKLELDYSIPGVDNLTILGFIFLKDLQLQSHILAFDTDNSPALIVHGNVQCSCIHLFGNVHYIGGQVVTNLLWAKYNHGELYLNGSIDAKVILADDMPIFIRKTGNVHALISMMGMNIYRKAGEEWLQIPGTHTLEAAFLPELCTIDDEGDTVLKEEGPGNVLEYIKQNKPLLQ